MKRFTETEKWSDPWFRSLSAVEKCLFVYCLDKCNNAGFIEIDIELWSFHLGIDKDDVEKAMKSMSSSKSKDKQKFITNDGWLFIKNFLRHQKNLPLFPHKNPAHKHIVTIFNQQETRFPRLLEAVISESLTGIERFPSYEQPDEDDKEEATTPAKAKKAPAVDKKRERNLVMDALAECDGDPLQIPAGSWGRIAKALSEIKSVMPDVAPDEIRRRAQNYKLHFKDAPLTSTALAKHWSRCDKRPSGSTTMPEQQEMKSWGDKWATDRK
jgi:hypothetical protein